MEPFHFDQNNLRVSLNLGDEAGKHPESSHDGVYLYVVDPGGLLGVGRVITGAQARELGWALIAFGDEHDQLVAEHKKNPGLPTEAGVYIGGTFGIDLEAHTLNDYVLVELNHKGKWKHVNQTTKKLGRTAKEWAENQISMGITLRKLVEEEK